LQFQIGGTGKRQATESRTLERSRRTRGTARFLAKKSSAKYLLRARRWRSTCREAACGFPADGGALEFHALGLTTARQSSFFRWRLSRSPESSCASSSPDPGAKRGALPLAGEYNSRVPRTLAGSKAREGQMATVKHALSGNSLATCSEAE